MQQSKKVIQILVGNSTDIQIIRLTGVDIITLIVGTIFQA